MERESIQPELKEGREPLSNQTMAALIAGTGNRENKAITLVIMQWRIIYTKYALYKTARDCQGKPPVWSMDKSSPFAFCQSSFEPVGLVAKAVVDPVANTWGYIKTDYGHEIGTPLSALLLDFSLRHPDISLFGLFGETGKSSKKSLELTVYKFLEFYKVFKKWVMEDQKFRTESPGVARKPKRKFDLTNDLEENARWDEIPSALLEHLDEYGVINYDSVDQQKPFVAIRAIPDANFDVSHYRDDATLSALFLTVIRKAEGKFLTLDEVTGLVLKENPDYTNKPLGWQKELRNRVAAIAVHYRKHRCVEVEKFDGDHKSEIKFTPEQEQIILELMDLLDRFQRLNQKTIARGHTLINSFTERQFAQLMKKAKDISPYANDMPYDQAKQEILQILEKNPNKEARPLLASLRERTGKRIAYKNQWAILKRMSNEKLVTSTNSKPKTWSLSHTIPHYPTPGVG